MIEYVIAAAALLCIGIKYINVSAMNGPFLGQVLRLSPIVGYLGLGLGVLYVPALLLPSLLATLVLRFLDELIVVHQIYSQARKSIPPTTAELLRRLRYAPWVLMGLVLVYILTIQHHQHTKLAAPADTTAVVAQPSAGQMNSRTKWENLKHQNP